MKENDINFLTDDFNQCPMFTRVANSFKNNAYLYTEGAAQTELRMIHVRADVDAAYKAILNRLDALMLLNGAAKYEAFVKELNERVDKFSNILAMRKGKAAKNKDENAVKK